MNRPPGIPPRIDCQKLERTVRIASLRASQELLTVAGYIRIHAAGIAVPDVHRSARQWGTGIVGDLREREFQLEWHTLAHHARRRIGADVRAHQSLIDKVRTLGHLRANYTVRGRPGRG